MAPIIVDPDKVHEFTNAASFYRWLGKQHDRETEVWIKIHKVGSDLPSITLAQAIEVALCWGWIDAIRKGFDNKSFLQRHTRRGPKSIWSQINVATVARPIDDGRMTAHGLAQVDAGKATGAGTGPVRAQRPWNFRRASCVRSTPNRRHKRCLLI